MSQFAIISASNYYTNQFTGSCGMKEYLLPWAEYHIEK